MANLFATHLQVVKKQFSDFFFALKCYPNSKFRKADLSLRSAYFFQSPYQTHIAFSKKQGYSDLYTYGETPLKTISLLAKAAYITEKDHVFDLGCGSGHQALWLASTIGCKVTAVDLVSEFIAKAEQARKRAKIENILFLQRDFCTLDFSKASVVFVTLTTTSDEEIERLSIALKSLKKGARVIAVSAPLLKAPSTVIEAPFYWGTSEVFLQNAP